MNKIKKLWQSKFFKNYFILTVSFLTLEIIFRLISAASILSYSSLRIFFGINVLAIIFSFILSFLPHKIAKVFNPLIILVATIYGIAELGFKKFLGVYGSVQSSTQVGAVKDYIIDFIKSFNWTFYLMFIPIILVLIYYIFFDKKLSLDLPRRRMSKSVFATKCLQFLLLIFCSLSFFCTMKLDFMQNKMQAISTYNLFKKPINPSLVVNDFGFIGFGLLDVKEYFLPGAEIIDEISYNPNIITNSNIASNPNTAIKPHVNIDNGIWKDIIEKEKNVEINSLNKYFISNSTTNTNEYTGMFEDKNVIFIMVESGSPIMLKEEYYPNIAKLYNEGWSWDNYYSPRNSCSTGNNEMSNIIGIHSIYNNCTANIFSKNTYFESIFNLFNNKGYATKSFHDYYDWYYARNSIHKNFGIAEYYDADRLNMDYNTSYGDWPSDEDFIDAYLNVLDEETSDEPFMHWLTTITSHQPFTDNHKYNLMYKDMFPSEYADDLKAYMSKLKVVDNAIGKLISGLEERELLEDTVIVMFADHYPYGIDQSVLSTAYGYDATIDNNSENVPFIIYNPSLKSNHYKDYTQHVNTTPTIANLFNLDFDSRIYVGHDVLDSTYESLVIFDDASWKNEYAYYDSSSNKIKYYTDKVYTDEEILAINESVSLKLKMSSSAIRNNYFSYLSEKISSYSATSIVDEENG